MDVVSPIVIVLLLSPLVALLLRRSRPRSLAPTTNREVGHAENGAQGRSHAVKIFWSPISPNANQAATRTTSPYAIAIRSLGLIVALGWLHAARQQHLARQHAPTIGLLELGEVLPDPPTSVLGVRGASE